jgi:peptidoglycan DL-endopeptidase CwlO
MPRAGSSAGDGKQGGLVQVRDGARRMLLTAGTGLALLVIAAGNAPSALAATRVRPAVAVIPGGTGAALGDPVLPGTAGAPGSGTAAVAVAHFSGAARTSEIAPLHRLFAADLFVVAPTTLRPSIVAAVQRLPGVVAAEQLDAARIEVNGKLTAMLGVDPSAFRAFTARPTAESLGLWENVAAGGVAVSYTMGKLDNLPLGRPVRVTGRRVEELPVAGLGTVGIGGVDAVVSDPVARSLGVPADNAIVISSPDAVLSSLMGKIGKLLPRGAAVAPLVAQTVSPGAAAGMAGAGVAGTGAAGAVAAGAAAGLTSAEVVAFLKAAESREGMPYVWGGDGPNVFDCSGLVQWSLAQAGVVMPRVAAEQALTGPLVPLSQLQPGDLLFYHTDPTAPSYISHVAIYLGDGMMIQAPAPGLDVEIVPADFGSEFAGAVQVDPKLAAAVAGNPAG